MPNLIRSDLFHNFFPSKPINLMNRLLATDPFTSEYPLMDIKNMDVDIKENKEAFTVHAEIPGVKKEDISVTVDGNQLTIKAEVKQEKEEKKDEKVIYNERYYGQFLRSFTLDQPVDEAKSSAHYENGVLTLTLTKKKGSPSKQLSIS